MLMHVLISSTVFCCFCGQQDQQPVSLGIQPHSSVVACTVHATPTSPCLSQHGHACMATSLLRFACRYGAIAAGAVSNPIMLWSAYTLATTGMCLRLFEPDIMDCG